MFRGDEGSDISGRSAPEVRCPCALLQPCVVWLKGFGQWLLRCQGLSSVTVPLASTKSTVSARRWRAMRGRRLTRPR